MRYLSICLALAVIFFTACQDEQPETKTQEPLPLTAKEEMQRLNDFMRKHESKPQIFTIPADKPSVIKGDKGSVWNIDPANLVSADGSPVTGEITVRLKELHTVGDFLKNNLQTVTADNRLLASGGTYFIGMEADGKQLKMKEGKSISAEFTKLAGEDMQLFYGNRDSMETMTWRETGNTFATAFDIVEEQQKDTAWMTIDKLRYTFRRPRQASRNLRSRMDEEAIDSIISYVDGKPMKEDKEKIEAYTKAKKLYKNIYQAIEVEELGWINVDRYMKSSLTPLYVTTEGADSNSFTKIYAIFKGVNGVIQGSYFGEEYSFRQIPKGEDIRLIAYSFKNDGILFDTRDINLTEDSNKIILTMRDATEDDINSFFN